MTTATIKPTAAEAIKQLAEKHKGEITPEIVVQEARKKRSPLHPYFEWNESEAAEKYRLLQAGYLIRRIKVTYDVSENKTVRVRAYVNVRDTEQEEPATNGIYVPIETALTVASYRDQLLDQCRRDVRAFQQKYSSLAEAQSIIDAMNVFHKSA